MDELIDHARVGLEVADQLLVLAALLERRVAELGVQLDGLGHLADVKRVGPHLINGHGDPPESSLHTVVTSRVSIMYHSLDIVRNRGEANTLGREVRVRSKGFGIWSLLPYIGGECVPGDGRPPGKAYRC